jgi:eukaryotic-like serine/threonine-protein kinase
MSRGHTTTTSNTKAVQDASTRATSAPAPGPRSPREELVLGRYRLRRRLGTGGMGVVWEAHDERLGRDVAVKRVPVDTEQPGDTAGKRAAREALAAARLGHPAIVALYEAGRDEGGWVLVSELVRGRTLAQLEAEGALSDRDVLRIGATLCDALAHAHARGVVHRDVKPSNVICPDESLPSTHGGAAAKLTDFGIARLADDDAVTRTGDVVGTLAYMAPEQARGERVTAAADTYALGLVLYEALSGTNPIRGAGAAETVARIGERIPPLRRSRRDLPADVCDAVDAAVRARPEDRIAPAELGAVLIAALPDADDEPGIVAAAPLEGVTRVWDATRRMARDRAVPAVEPAADLDPRLRTRLQALDPRLAQPAAVPEEELPARRGITLPGRAVGALAAAGLTAVALGRLDALAGGGLLSPGRTPLAIVVAVGLGVFALPRLAWLTAAAVCVAWVAEGGPGVAVLLAAGIVPVVPLLWRSGWAWSLPGGAVALGLGGVAAAWPAVAGQLRTIWSRGALGALGAWWLLLAEPLLDERLLLGRGDASAHPAAWRGSVVDVYDRVLAPLLTGGTVALCAVWAVAAAVLPLLVRGRTAAVDMVVAACWAIALGVATGAVATAAGVPDPRGLVAGSLLAGAVAVVARAVRIGRG